MRNKTGDLVDYILHDCKPDIVAITESWLGQHDDAVRVELCPVGYNLLDHTREKREALKYARGLKSADQHATRVENQMTTEVTVKQEINKTTVNKSREKLCFNCGKRWPHQGGQRKCPAFGKQCTRCGKRNHFANCCKNKQEIKLAQGSEQITDTSSDSSDERVHVHAARGELRGRVTQ